MWISPVVIYSERAVAGRSSILIWRDAAARTPSAAPSRNIAASVKALMPSTGDSRQRSFWQAYELRLSQRCGSFSGEVDDPQEDATNDEELAGRLAPHEREEVEHLFQSQVFPALTPLVIGRGRPFPYISNMSLSLGVLLRNPEKGEEVAATPAQRSSPETG